MKTMTVKQLQSKVMQDVKIQDTVCYLWERWQDERDYEDFKDYAKQVSLCITGNKLVKSCKRPFEFTFECPDGYLQLGVKTKGRYMEVYTKATLVTSA